MRPKIRVVLLAANEEEMSLWKFRIAVAGYLPRCATKAIEASDLIPESRAVVVVGGDDRDCAIVKLGNYEAKVLAVGGVYTEQCQADATIERGPYLTERVMSKLKILCQLKRGPKSKHDPL